jgi:D-serine dehydratase
VPFSDGHLDRLDDQHGYLRMGPGEAHVDVGDRVGFGLSHPCTAFDKWRTVLLVSDEYEILEEIRTFFH